MHSCEFFLKWARRSAKSSNEEIVASLTSKMRSLLTRDGIKPKLILLPNDIFKDKTEKSKYTINPSKRAHRDQISFGEKL